MPAGSKTSPRVPRSFLAAWLVSLPLAFAGMAWSAPRGASLGERAALKMGLPPGAGYAIGGLASLALVGTVIPVTAVGAMLSIRRGDSRSEAWLGARRVRRLGGALIVYGIAAFPVSVLGSPLLVGLVGPSTRHRPGLRGTLSFTVVGLAMLGFAAGWSALFTWRELGGALLLVALLTLGVRRARAQRLGALAFLAAALILPLWPPMVSTTPTRLWILAATLPVFCAPMALGGRSIADRVPLPIWSLFFGSALFWGHAFLFGVLPSAREVQPPVEAIYRSGGMPYSDNRFILRNCTEEGWLVGHREELGLMRLAQDGRVLAAVPHSVGNNAILDCPSRELVTSDYDRDEVVVYDSETLARKEVYEVGDVPGLMHVQLGNDRRRIYVNDEAMRLLAIDRPSKTIQVLDVGRNARGFWVDEPGKRVYVSDAGRVRMKPLGTSLGGLERDLRGHRSPFDAWEKNRLIGSPRYVYASRYLSGRLVRLHPETLDVVADAHVGLGVRDLAYDAQHGILFAAQYVRGFVIALDGETLEVLGALQVGRRVRQLEVDGSAVLGTSAVGGWRIGLDRWLPLRTNESPTRRPERSGVGGAICQEDVEDLP